MRTALDVMGWAPTLTEAVVRLDLLLRAGAVYPERLRAVQLNSDRVQRAVALPDGRSESPQEPRLRVTLVLAGLPAPVPQYEVRGAGRLIARVDPAYPRQRIAIAYDGRWHDTAGQFARDRCRLSALAAAGWRVILVTAADLHHPREVISLVRAALLDSV
ncbi:hypothetical protein BH18ACT7_BH18ACT7_02000 [soil metagenome]